VALISLDLILKLDDAEAKSFAGFVLTQQAAENGVGIEPGRTTPYNLALLVYQRPNVTVANQPQIKRAPHLRLRPSNNPPK
jgi:hypothetical protein